jgi:hypothetical protein
MGTCTRRGREIVAGYDTRVTLRQVFYRLVAGQHLPNTQTYYRALSSATAAARRDGTFPSWPTTAASFTGTPGTPRHPMRWTAWLGITSATTPRASLCRSTWPWRSAGW